jgi:hypothetical protein
VLVFKKPITLAIKVCEKYKRLPVLDGKKQNSYFSKNLLKN